MKRHSSGPWSGRLLSVAVLVCAAVILIAAAPASSVEPREHGKTAVGKVVSIDRKLAKFTVRNAASESTTLFWSSATNLTGGNLALGVSVEVKYLQKNGKNWATSIRVPPVEGSAKR